MSSGAVTLEREINTIKVNDTVEEVETGFFRSIINAFRGVSKDDPRELLKTNSAFAIEVLEVTHQKRNELTAGKSITFESESINRPVTIEYI